MKDHEQILLHIARGEFLSGGKLEDFELWIGLFSEKLGCDPRPSAIAVAIDQLISETDRMGKMLRRLRSNERPSVVSVPVVK